MYSSNSKTEYLDSILSKSTAGRYRPVSYPDGPIMVRCRLKKNKRMLTGYQTTLILMRHLKSISIYAVCKNVDKRLPLETKDTHTQKKKKKKKKKKKNKKMELRFYWDSSYAKPLTIANVTERIQNINITLGIKTIDIIWTGLANNGTCGSIWPAHNGIPNSAAVVACNHIALLVICQVAK